jgi:putative ABC transport system permease protein
MRHWLQLATRSWRAKPGRTAASLVAVALGVGTVVTMTSFYESIRHAVSDQMVNHWLGNSHVTVQSPGGHWGKVPQALADPIAGLDNVAAVTLRLCRRVNLWRAEEAATASAPRGASNVAIAEVDANGVIPEREEPFRQLQALLGRRLAPGERGAILLEARLAREAGLALGDAVRIECAGRQMPLTIIGTFERARVGEFQRPEVQVALEDLQELKNEPGTVTIIDVMLHDTSEAALNRTAEQLAALAAERGGGVQVFTAAARLRQLEEAQRITQLILILVAFIALLTAFFIIVTTMSMGIVERMVALGVMRCLGVTRRQLTALVLAEVLPLGVLGTALGVPVGIGLTHLGARLVPAYVAEVLVSPWGVRLAVTGGILTSLIGAVVLVVQVGRVSPLAATNPESQPTRRRWAIAAAAAGLASLAAHHAMLRSVDAAAWFNPVVALCGTVTIYLAYVLVVPGLIALMGSAVVNGVGRLLRIHPKLARDQIGRAPWRSAGICWMLMVGLSLIVYLAVRGESVIAAWDFPSKLAEAFVWTQEPVPRAKLENARRIAGVGDVTAIHNIVCTLGTEKKALLRLLKPFTMFVAGDPEGFLGMSKLEFLEGSLADAEPKLKRGGYLLLPPESSRALNLHYGDRVDVTIGGRTASFEIAGIVQSPAMDIAVSYFQADSYMTLAASGAVLGTLDDVRDRFGLDDISTVLLDFKLPPAAPPATFAADAPPAVDAESVARQVLDWTPQLPEEADALNAAGTAWTDFVTRGKPLPPQAERELSRFQRALAFVAQSRTRPADVQHGPSLFAAEYWESLAPAERWDLFREQLVMLKLGAAVGKPDAQHGSLRRLKQTIDNDIRRATLLVSIIPVIALVVATLGVANLITVSVNARTRQIAVLRAVGALQSQIVRLVLCEALTLGVIGCAIGIALGMHTAHSMNTITEQLVGVELVFRIPWGRVAGAAALTLLIALFAGIGPARHAARSNIVGALQAF